MSTKAKQGLKKWYIARDFGKISLDPDDVLRSFSWKEEQRLPATCDGIQN